MSLIDAADGNPDGLAVASPGRPPEEVLAAATHQRARPARVTAALTPVRAS